MWAQCVEVSMVAFGEGRQRSMLQSRSAASNVRSDTKCRGALGAERLWRSYFFAPTAHPSPPFARAPPPMRRRQRVGCRGAQPKATDEGARHFATFSVVGGDRWVAQPLWVVAAW